MRENEKTHLIQEKSDTVEDYEEEPLPIKFTKDVLEQLGDEFEKRLRKVLSEFLSN